MLSVVLSFSKERIGAVALAATGTPLIHLAKIDVSDSTVTVSASTPENSTEVLYPVERKLVPISLIVLAVSMMAVVITGMLEFDYSN
jgi:hypothetical protein